MQYIEDFLNLKKSRTIFFIAIFQNFLFPNAQQASRPSCKIVHIDERLVVLQDSAARSLQRHKIGPVNQPQPAHIVRPNLTSSTECQIVTTSTVRTSNPQKTAKGFKMIRTSEDSLATVDQKSGKTAQLYLYLYSQIQLNFVPSYVVFSNPSTLILVFTSFSFLISSCALIFVYFSLEISVFLHSD